LGKVKIFYPLKRPISYSYVVSSYPALLIGHIANQLPIRILVESFIN